MTRRRLPRNDAAILNANILLEGELAYDTTNNELRVGEGVTPGSSVAGGTAELSEAGGSALVGFLQAGTGAVARTAQAKLRDFVSAKDFGAVGDGVADDTTAIQSAINYVFANDGGDVFLPKGIYKITKPLYVWGSASYVFNAVRLVGAGVDCTVIKKSGNGTKADGSWYGAIDAIVILTPNPAPVSVTPATGTYNASLTDLTIRGDSGSMNAYGIYTKDDFGQLKMARLCIEETTNSFRTEGNMWLSSWENISMHPAVDGFYMNKSGTSNTLKNCFVLGGSGVGYNLQALYSHAMNIACDGFTGSPYVFRFSQWAVSGMGVESAAATGPAVTVANSSTVVLNSPLFLCPNAFSVATACKLKVYGGQLGDVFSPTARTGALWFVAGTGELTLENLTNYDTFGTANTGFASEITTALPGTGAMGVGGIKFPATPIVSADPNVMNDYKVGTWTATDTGVKDLVSGTWTSGTGKYTKIGNKVYVTVNLTGTAIGFSSANGYYKWGGLPFTPSSTSAATWASDNISASVGGFILVNTDGTFWIYGAQSIATAATIVVSFEYLV